MLPITIATAVQNPSVRAWAGACVVAVPGMCGPMVTHKVEGESRYGRMRIVISILRRERQVVRRFREGNATAPSAARTLDELQVPRGSGLRRLRHRVVIREAGAERFYLDEEVWEALESTRRRVSIAVLCLIVLLIVAVLAVRRLHAV